MATKYYALLTNVGAAKLANATALGEQVEITQMAVGDGNGALPTPNPAQTALVHELRRAPLNTLTIDPVNTNQIIAEQVIPEDVGGWWIREIGLYDSDGDMIAVANCAETYKPLLQEGSGRMQVIRVILIVSSTQAVTLKIDPSVVLATRQYVDDQIIQVKAFVDQQLAAHIAAADPHKQYAPKASPALMGTPTAPTATAGNNSTQLANTAFVKAALVAVIGGAPTTLDTLKEIATAINNDPNFSATINNALALKAPLASPAMTGTPTAPTAAQTVNNTQIATTEFVKSAIAALVASSPAALDTLNELAAALGNDPNFATTVTNALAGKQPLDSTLTDLSGKTVNGILQYLQLRESFSGVVGQSRNARMSVAAASATATFSADELIVEDSVGRQYRVTSFSKGINLATTGAGGMDTGSVPTTGFVALYAIYNPTTATSALLAVNATSTTAPEIYGGANMPAGFTASALVSIWRVASGKFIVGFQRERTIAIERVVAANSTVPVNTLTSLSIANIIPMNAVAISGMLAVAGINTTNAITELTASANYLAAVQAGGNSTTGGVQNISVSPYSDMPITTSQSTYWRSRVESGTFTSGTVYINGYKF